MRMEVISKRDNLLIRRQVLEPGEALPWHVDLCHRFTVVVQGEQLQLEFRETGETETFAVHAGLAEWDKPEPRIHRGINVGSTTYEEVVMFFLDTPDMDPQPEQPE